jgi:hypothetical protein
VPPTEFDIERRSAGDSRAAVAFGVSTCSRENSGLDYGVANLALFTGPLRIRTRACEGRFGSKADVATALDRRPLCPRKQTAVESAVRFVPDPASAVAGSTPRCGYTQLDQIGLVWLRDSPEDLAPFGDKSRRAGSPGRRCGTAKSPLLDQLGPKTSVLVVGY